MKRISILDYGAGNIFSIKNAVEKCGYKSILTSDFERILKSTHLIFPGVGSFDNCIQKLKDKKIYEKLKALENQKIWVLGICVGMQALFNYSEEGKKYKGLGIINGEVKKMKSDKQSGPRKVPFIGWKNVVLDERKKKMKIFSDTTPDDRFYFIHSYECVPKKKDNVIATVYYNKKNVCAVVKKNNIFGCQFHPEKSGEAGLNIIKNFIEYENMN